MAKQISYCSVESCSTRIKSSGLCVKHLKRFQRYGDVNFVSLVRRKKLLEQGLSYCSQCREFKATKDFPKDKSNCYGCAYTCKKCCAINARKSAYNISEEDYNNLLTLQQGRCAICKGLQQRNGVALCVDHDHETKETRGLLCDNCNRALGFLKENLTTLEAATHYLNKHFMVSEKWDRRFLKQCEDLSEYSHDPSTKAGALVANKKWIVSQGYNGFPTKLKDFAERYENRHLKLSLIIHAELNAILTSPKNVEGCTLYTTPFPPCAPCASIVAQAGIKRVVSWDNDVSNPRWSEDFKVTQDITYPEANIELCLYHKE